MASINDKAINNTCYCDEPDQEMWWDGVLRNYDPNCSCCKDTKSQEGTS